MNRVGRERPSEDGRHARPVQASWPELTCYGCGPANPDGLHVESYVASDGRTLVATVEPSDAFNVVPGVASVVDCNSIWAAMTFASPFDARPPDGPPAARYVTAELRVSYLKPTPLGVPLEVRSWVDGDVGRRVRVLTEVGPPGDVTATGEVVAVRVEGAFGA